MRNLILLLVKNGGPLLFLVLEALCFYMVVQFNKKQNQIYFGSTAVISGAINSQFDELAKYWNINEVLDSMSRKNAALYEENTILKLSQERTADLPDDSLRIFKYIPGKVISNSITSRNNYLTLKLGKKDSIQAGLGVISDGGIVGVTTSATQNFSSVMSVLHRESYISASIRKSDSNYPGFLVWRSKNPRTLKLIDVPNHANIMVNDTVQTSGYSTIFPPGLLIGKVTKVYPDEGNNFITADVQLFNDLSSVRTVYVIKNLLRKELDKLEAEKKDE